MLTRNIATILNASRVGLVVLIAALAGCGGRPLEPEGLLATARKQMESGDLGNARDALLQVCADHPQSVTAHVNLAMTYWQLGDVTAAAAALDRATELVPKNAQIWELRAHLLIQTGNPEGAIEVLDHIKAPTASTLTLKSLAQQLSGNPDQALYHLEQALKLDRYYPPALHNLAILQRDQFNAPIEAMTAWRRFREADPQNPRASINDDLFLENMSTIAPEPTPVSEPEPAPAPPAGDNRQPPAPTPVPTPPPTPPRAINTPTSNPAPNPPDTRAETEPASAKALIAKAKREIARGNNDSALLALKDAVQRYPDNADAVWALAVFYDKQLGLKGRADGLYKTFLGMFPDDPRAKTIQIISRQTQEPAPPAHSPSPDFFQKGLAHYAKQEWDDAIAAYRQALSLDPRSESCAYNLGLAYKAKNDLDAAAAAFRHALNINPDMVKSLYMLGLTDIQRKRNADALAHLNRLIGIQPDFAKAHYLLGTVYQTENQPDTAAHHFDRFLELDPTDKAAPQVKRWLQQHRR